jgi:fatty acid desaturase
MSHMLYEMLSIESSDEKKMNITFEHICVCVILFFLFFFQLIRSFHISHHFNFRLIIFLSL